MIKLYFKQALAQLRQAAHHQSRQHIGYGACHLSHNAGGDDSTGESSPFLA